MTDVTLFLFEDHVPAGAKPVFLPGGDRALYVRSGAVEVSSDERADYVVAGAATVTREEITITAGDDDTVLWRWELLAGDSTDPAPHRLRSAPATSSTLLLSTQLDLDDRYTWLMRCDTVTFPPGGVAMTHLHQGPGIRAVLYGEITIDTEGTSNTYGTGQAWAEKGVAPVYAPTTESESTRFVRCFLLPKQNKGSSSLRIVSAADRQRTNTQSYRVLSERVLTRQP